MQYRIAICDDSQADRDFLSGLVRAWGAARNARILLDFFCSAEAFLFQYAEDKRFDLLLLDIEMGGMDGVALARRLRQENEAIQIVFVTGYSDYIADGYDVSALHYLMKPVDSCKLFSVLDRAAEKLRHSERALLLEISGEMVRVPFREILYLEVQQNYVTVHARTDYTVKRPLSEFAAVLDERFFRAGRSYLVNLDVVERVSKTQIFLAGGCCVPLPRGAYQAINRAIIARS